MARENGEVETQKAGQKKENPLDDGLVGCIFRVIKLFVCAN